MRVKLIIEYEGTNYAGWQRQKNAVAVQQVIEEAIHKSLGEETAIVGAGRTDAGVHAFGQVAHFDTETNIPADKLSYVLNMVLPPDIRIRESAHVEDDFNARRDATGKHYRYIIYNDAHAPAINRQTRAHVRYDLDDGLMKAAARYFVGTHDFESFHAANTDIVGTVRTLHAVEVTRIAQEIYIDVLGNGFLYNMVRIMVGTLIDVGKGKTAPADIPAIIEGRRRDLAGATAPAKGLTLMEVMYEGKKRRLFCLGCKKSCE